MSRTTLHVALAIVAAAAITWACIVAVRANSEPGFDSGSRQFGAALFLLAMHVGFSRCVELKGGISVAGLVVGLGFWTLLLLPGVIGDICAPGSEALETAYRFLMVFPAFLLGKFLFLTLRRRTPREPEIPVAIMG